jgi:curli biogenesis system outer membrane secretion channel CsgG
MSIIAISDVVRNLIIPRGLGMEVAHAPRLEEIMKSLSLILLLNFALAFLSLEANAAEKASRIRISVTKFDQQVDHWYPDCQQWHGWRSQNQLQTVLEKELSELGLQVLERQEIRRMHSDEFEMANLNQKTVAKRNQFVAAKYAVVGGITEMGVCEESSDSGIQLGGIVSLLGGPSTDLKLDTSGATSKIAVMGKLISVETGKVIKTFEAEGSVSDSDKGIRAEVAGIGGNHRSRKQPPLERASNLALRELAQKIASYLQK